VNRLLHFFSSVFSFGLRLDEGWTRGEIPEDAADTQRKVQTLLEHARASATAAGKRSEHVDAAAFAVVAWIDEVMVRNPGDWTSVRPLQVTLFNTNNAGNEFFNQLSGLKATEDEVREVFYHALLLGFVGQYYFETGDNGDLGKIKAQHARQIPIAPAPTHVLREEKITQQPYSVADPSGPRFPRQWDRLLLNVGIVLALLIPAGYLLYFYLNPNRDSGPTLQQLVDERLVGSRYTCSELVGRVGAQGATTISGFVVKPEDIERLRKDVQAIEGIGRLSMEVKVRIWPHCEVVDLLRQFRERNLKQKIGVSVAPNDGHSIRFIEGEALVPLLTHANYKGYLYVDYYVVDGYVRHLYPDSNEPDSGRRLVPGEKFTVGDGAKRKDKNSIEIFEPFGQELITVIASPVPLFGETGRPVVEQAKDYIPQLRKALAENGVADTAAADFLFLQTERKVAGVEP